MPRGAKTSAPCRRWSAAARSIGRGGCRASPRTTSACAPSRATCPARASRTGRSPYDELEPYYLKVEWAFGVSGEAGANRFESRRSGGYPCPPMPRSRYADKFMKGCAALGWNAFPTPQGPPSPPPLQTAAGRRWSAPSPSSTATPPARAPPPSTSSYRMPWRQASTTCVPTPTSASSCWTARAASRRPSTRTPTATRSNRTRTSFILACGAMETARLMLLSKSGRFPSGLANGSDLVGRNVTFHEYSAAVGTYDDPVYAWAGGGYVSASTFQHYEHDSARGFVSGGHIAVAGVGIPLPINWRLPGTPAWGAEAKRIDARELQPLLLAIAMVLHDMAAAARQPHRPRRQCGRRLGPAGGAHDAEGASERPRPGPLPHRPRCRHPGGQRSADRHQGLCRPRHGQLLAPARHGPHGRTIPNTSVLNRWLPRATKSKNLYVGRRARRFPTGTGANPTLTIMANAWRGRRQDHRRTRRTGARLRPPRGVLTNAQGPLRGPGLFLAQFRR